jgi:UDP-N-acetylglucosamine 2-epimerase (non-hydrolysing)
MQSKRKLIIFTMHRREAFSGLADAILEQIYPALFLSTAMVKKEWQPLLVYLQHPNPKTSFITDFFAQQRFTKKVIILPPLDYQDTIYLLKNAFIVMTDSGGILEEAVSLRKPVICLREKTERFFSAVKEDVFLVGNKAKDFSIALKMAIARALSTQISKTNAFGDGQAALKIVNVLKNLFESNNE